MKNAVTVIIRCRAAVRCPVDVPETFGLWQRAIIGTVVIMTVSRGVGVLVLIVNYRVACERGRKKNNTLPVPWYLLIGYTTRRLDVD